MTRIFFTLAILAVVLLSINLWLGWRMGDLNGLANEYLQAGTEQEKQQVLQELEPVQERSTLHILFGVAASLVTVLVASITITYFIGTSRWVREVCTMYRLDENYIREADRLKRRTFPWAVTTMLTILAIILLGGASLPGNPSWDSARWVTPHMAAALGGVVIIAFSFLRQGINITENYAAIQRIMGEVARVRQEHGLEVESGA